MLKNVIQAKKFLHALTDQPHVAPKELSKEDAVALTGKTGMVEDVLAHALLGVDNLMDLVADVINRDTGVIMKKQENIIKKKSKTIHC